MAGRMEDSDLRLVVDCASLAPSVHNTQPWRFHLDDDVLEVHADRERALGYLDPSGRQLHISCGAAMEFARLALRDLGRACELEVCPDEDNDDLLARLTIGDAASPTELERSMAEAMSRRFTDRSPYDGRPVPADVLTEAKAVAASYGVWLRVIDDAAQRTVLASVLTDAEAAEAADSAYAEELARWTRTETSADGVPVAATGDWPASIVTDVPLRDFTGHGAHPRPGGGDEPPVVVRDTLLLLGTEGDGPVDWLNVGRALGWLLLRAAVAGLSSQPLGPAVDQHTARERLRHELGLVGHPQFLLRMGYGSGRPTTGRRAAEESLDRPR